MTVKHDSGLLTKPSEIFKTQFKNNHIRFKLNFGDDFNVHSANWPKFPGAPSSPIAN